MIFAENFTILLQVVPLDQLQRVKSLTKHYNKKINKLNVIVNFQ